jgi:hypothetical protein
MKAPTVYWVICVIGCEPMRSPIWWLYPFFLNIMIHSSPACSRKKSLWDHPYDGFIIWCRPESIEFILCASLFPPEFPTKGRVKHWVTAVTYFDKNDMKALESILLQKQRCDFPSIDCLNWRWGLSESGFNMYMSPLQIIRVQQEMLKYMSLRQLSQVSANLE